MKVNQHHYLIKALSVSALFFLLGQARADFVLKAQCEVCLLYTSPSPRDVEESRMPSSA